MQHGASRPVAASHFGYSRLAAAEAAAVTLLRDTLTPAYYKSTETADAAS